MNKLMSCITPISIALILASLASLFLWPAAGRPLMWFAVAAGTAAAIILAVGRHFRRYRQEHHNRWKFVRNAGLEIIGILLAIVGAIWLAGIVAGKVVPATSGAFEFIRPGTGNIAGIIAGLIAALTVGLGAGFIVRWIWGKLMARLGSFS